MTLNTKYTLEEFTKLKAKLYFFELFPPENDKENEEYMKLYYEYNDMLLDIEENGLCF